MGDEQEDITAGGGSAPSSNVPCEDDAKSSTNERKKIGGGDDLTDDHIMPDNVADRLSNLKDYHLCQILNYLPTVDAVRTLALRRFGNLWASSLQNLVFDSSESQFSSDQKNQRFTKFVTRVLGRYQRTEINKFELKFGSVLYFKLDVGAGCRRTDSFLLKQLTRKTVDSWIKWALTKNVKILDVGLLQRTNPSDIAFYYDFPVELLGSSSIEELSLRNVLLGVPGEPINFSMTYLKVLSLAAVLVETRKLHQIMDGCPLMERLELIQCQGFWEVECSSENLKILKVDLGDEVVQRPVLISGPYLASLHLTGIRGSFKLEQVSSLQELKLDFVNRAVGRSQKRLHKNLLKILENINSNGSSCS